MDSNEQDNDVRKLDATRENTPRTYNFLLRLSRRMGRVATHSSVDRVKSFLNQEITLPSPDRIFGGVLQPISNNPTHDSKATALKKIVEQSHEVLMSANTVFPISLFPDTVTVDRTKVTIIKRNFFWSSDVMSIRIEDVLNVSASVGPLFGSLTVASRVMSTIDHFKIDNFWRNDAIRLKHIIQGYVIAQHNKIDTAHLNKKELIETLIELGNDSNS